MRKLNEMKQDKIILLQGPPAAGKSTWAKKWQKEDRENRVIVNMDSIRNMRGEYWIPSQEQWVKIVELEAIKAAIKLHYDICIDATNLSQKRKTAIEALIKNTSYEIEEVMLNPGMKTCIERDKNSDRDHHVGEDVIKQFYKHYNLKEYGE